MFGCFVGKLAIYLQYLWFSFGDHDVANSQGHKGVARVATRVQCSRFTEWELWFVVCLLAALSNSLGNKRWASLLLRDSAACAILVLSREYCTSRLRTTNFLGPSSVGTDNCVFAGRTNATIVVLLWMLNCDRREPYFILTRYQLHYAIVFNFAKEPIDWNNAILGK